MTSDAGNAGSRLKSLSLKRQNEEVISHTCATDACGLRTKLRNVRLRRQDIWVKNEEAVEELLFKVGKRFLCPFLICVCSILSNSSVVSLANVDWEYCFASCSTILSPFWDSTTATNMFRAQLLHANTVLPFYYNTEQKLPSKKKRRSFFDENCIAKLNAHCCCSVPS